MATLDLDALMGHTNRESKVERMEKFKSQLKSTEAAEEAKIVAEPARKRQRPGAEEKWWVLPEQKLTPEVKRDLQIIQSRGFIDPKRFYKTDKEQKKLPKRFQIGTIVESAFDGPAGRLTNKQRQSTIALELLADEQFKEYGQKHVSELSQKKSAGSKKAYSVKVKGRRRKSRR